jgi:Cu+-exporting ATPase
MPVVFEVQKMFCQGCARHVVEAVEAAQPGAEVRVDLATKQVEVSPPPENPNRLIEAIGAAGYEAHLLTARQ